MATESHIDGPCIFPEVKFCPNIHCGFCDTYVKLHAPMSIVRLYHFRYAYLHANGEVPEHLRQKKRFYAKSQAQREKELRTPKHTKFKMSKSEAKKRDWAAGVYNKKKRSHGLLFGRGLTDGQQPHD